MLFWCFTDKRLIGCLIFFVIFKLRSANTCYNVSLCSSSSLHECRASVFLKTPFYPSHSVLIGTLITLWRSSCGPSSAYVEQHRPTATSLAKNAACGFVFGKSKQSKFSVISVNLCMNARTNASHEHSSDS